LTETFGEGIPKSSHDMHILQRIGPGNEGLSSIDNEMAGKRELEPKL